MTVDSIVFRNLEHLLQKNGITEKQCTLCCGLNGNYFVNYRKKRTKHFKIHDLMKLAIFFDVDMNYLCSFSNTSEDFFMPKYTLKVRDEKKLLAGFKRLDPVGRIVIADEINKEIENSKAREKERRRTGKKFV